MFISGPAYNSPTSTLAIMDPQPDPNLASLGTPENCVADFCLIPVLVPYLFQLLHGCIVSGLTVQQIGTTTASVSEEVAQVQRLMQKSNLSYSMHSAGTTVGP